MSSTPGMLVLAMVGLALVGGLLLVAIIKRHHDEWDLTAWFVLGVAWIVNAPPLIAGLTGRYVVKYDPVQQTNVRVLEAAPSTVYAYLLLLGTVAAVALVVTRAANRKLVSAALVALVLGLLMDLMNGFYGTPSFTRGAIFTLMALLAAATLTPGRGAWLGATVFGVSLVVVSAVFTAYQPGDGSRFCQSKCGPLGVLVVGVTDSENAFALAVVVALPWVWISLSGRLRLAVMLYGIATIWLTGSRTSLVAGAALLVLLLLLRPARTGQFRGRDLVARTALIAATIGGLVLPHLPWDYRAFSLRGGLWQLAAQRMAEARWLGFGSSGWNHLFIEGRISAGAIYSPHNQWLDAQYALGYLGLVLFGWWLVLVVQAGRANIQRTAIILFPALVVGFTERAWSFGLPDWLSWGLVAVCLSAPRAGDSGEVEEAGAGVEPVDLDAGRPTRGTLTRS